MKENNFIIVKLNAKNINTGSETEFSQIAYREVNRQQMQSSEIHSEPVFKQLIEGAEINKFIFLVTILANNLATLCLIYQNNRYRYSVPVVSVSKY